MSPTWTLCGVCGDWSWHDLSFSLRNSSVLLSRLHLSPLKPSTIIISVMNIFSEARWELEVSHLWLSPAFGSPLGSEIINGHVRCWSWGLGDFFWGDISKCLLTFRQGTDDRLTETNKQKRLHPTVAQWSSKFTGLTYANSRTTQPGTELLPRGWFSGTFIFQRSTHLAGPSRILYPWSSLLNWKAAQ